MDDASDYVDFMVKYGDWVSIKRLAIRPDTKPEEVVFHLAGIRSTIDNKSFPLLGINTAVLDVLAAKVTFGKKKNYEDLSKAISELSGTDAKRAVEEACKGNLQLPKLAKIYLLGKVISSLDFDSSINQTIMSKIFPDMKPPRKPLGRKAKAQSD